MLKDDVIKNMRLYVLGAVYDYMTRNPAHDPGHRIIGNHAQGIFEYVYQHVIQGKTLYGSHSDLTLHVASEAKRIFGPLLNPEDPCLKLSVTNYLGVPIIVRLIKVGQMYGMDHQLKASSPIVQFWDARHDHDPIVRAQFITAYALDTVLSRELSMGLILAGGVDGWDLDQHDFAKVYDWLVKVTG